MTETDLIDTATNIGNDILDTLKKALLLTQNFESKVNQIEEFNISQPTKFIYQTYMDVLSDFQVSFSGVNMSVQTKLDKNMQKLTKINQSLDLIIALYSSDTKPMDKELKKALSLKEKNELLFPLFLFDNDGRLSYNQNYK
jgi:tRNA A37 threonylcarbamoyltransferase TsaD